MSRPRNRPNRKPIGHRDVLKAEENKGFKRRFVNDEPGRIQMFLDAGYRIVDEHTSMGTEDVGQASQVGSVAHKPVGGGKSAILMEIKEDWYIEDQLAKEERIQETERSILHDEDGIDRSKGLYGEGVSIKKNRPRIQVD